MNLIYLIYIIKQNKLEINNYKLLYYKLIKKIYLNILN